MRFVLSSAIKDLRRRSRDPLALVMWVGIPLVVGGLLALISSGPGSGTPTARLLVVDQDDSLLSGLLTGAMAQDGIGEFLVAELVTLEVGRERIDNGDASALLIIPAGFGDAVLAEEPTELQLIINPAQRILPGIIEEGLEILIEATFYGQRLLGSEINDILDATEGDGPTLAQVTTITERVYARVESAEAMLFPPALVLANEPTPEAAEEDDDASNEFNIARLFLPAMLFMSILFVGQGMSDDLWHESLHGTLRRLLTTPRRVEEMLLGKVLAGMVLMGAVAGVAMPVAWWLIGVAPARLPFALLWCMFAGGVLLIYFLTVQSLATSQRGGSILSTVILFPLMMIGGSFFPFAAMPEWMQAIGRFTPNGLALTQFEEILVGTPTADGLASAAAWIGLPAIAAFAVCSMRLRTGPLARG